MAAYGQLGASAVRILLLRVAYLLAAAGTAEIVILTVSGKTVRFLDEFTNSSPGFHGPRFPPEVVTAVQIVEGGLFAALLGLFVFLAIRPYWWGKLICIACGCYWFTGTVMASMMADINTTIYRMIAAASAVLLAALEHQIADPRFDTSGP